MSEITRFGGVLIAHDLLHWTQTLLLTGQQPRAESRPWLPSSMKAAARIVEQDIATALSPGAAALAPK